MSVVVTGDSASRRRRRRWSSRLLLVVAVVATVLRDVADGFSTVAPVTARRVAPASPSVVRRRDEVGASSTSTSPSTSRRRMSLGEEWYGEDAEKDDDDEDDDDDDDGSDDIDLGDRDWRAFRAQLVMGSEASESTASSSSSATAAAAAAAVEDEEDLDGIGAAFAASEETFSFSPLGDSRWAYDSGKVIEKGAVIMGGVEQDFGFGLRQQYFHKTVILVLEHDESRFTKGVILNRPTDMSLSDKESPDPDEPKYALLENDGAKNDESENASRRWRVWFGGDVQGWDSRLPDVTCVHSLAAGVDARVDEVSSSVVGDDIRYTSYEDARALVEEGRASPSDFWTFSGYAGWGPGQLAGEIDRRSWYTVATDSGTLLRELARQTREADPRDAGLDTWELLMDMIGKRELAEQTRGGFDDLMLKEWARERLLSDRAVVVAADDRDDNVDDDDDAVPSTQELERADPVDRLLSRASAAARGEDVRAGHLLRARDGGVRPPFLLKRQEFHRSVMVVLADDDKVSCGALLHLPAARGLELRVKEKDAARSSDGRVVEVPLRYGGEYAVKGDAPLLWLHCDNERLRRNGVGRPLSPIDDDDASSCSVWRCTSEDATAAMSAGWAVPSDFLVVSGVCVWTKGEGGRARGLRGETRKGNFEVVDASRTREVWETLRRQETLTRSSLRTNLALGKRAWTLCGDETRPRDDDENDDDDDDEDVVKGLGENYDEEDERFVHKSDVTVSELSDDALRSWVTTFLLGSVGSGG